MGNFLYELGLGFFNEDTDQAQGLIADVLRNGKAVTGYYDLPYINHHYGEMQISARVGHGEGDSLEFKGFDSHCDSLTTWPLRIVDQLPIYDEDDITAVKLMVKSSAGHNFLHVDVLNGDILPSFKKDETIELQMIAFSSDVSFYADEDDYSEHAGIEAKGSKYTLALNTVFPVGLFSDDDNNKEFVQIVAEIKKMRRGHCQFGEQDFTPNYRFYVDTPLGELVIVVPDEVLEKLESTENIAPGKIISCFARLSGDAAVNEYENGIVKDAENNLKLVAYSLENGDPERMRSVLAKNFVYHSDSSGKDINDINEYIEFAKDVNKNAKSRYTSYATIEEIADGEEDLEYSVGTRCAVIRYEGEDDFDAIIFVDTDAEGCISRILLSREPRYRFRVDEPPADEISWEEVIARQTWQEAMINRARYHNLIAEDQGLEEADAIVTEKEYEIKNDLLKQFNEEISQKTFSAAYMRGVGKSGIRDYNEEHLMDLGKQFYRDYTLRLSDEEQVEQFKEALMLVYAIGRMYCGDN